MARPRHQAFRVRRVEEDGVDARHLRIAEEPIQVPEVSLEELVRRAGGFRLQPPSRRRERHVILVDAQEQPVRPDGPRHRGRVPRTAEGAVAHGLAAPEPKLFEHFLEHYRFMPIFRCQRFRRHA